MNITQKLEAFSNITQKEAEYRQRVLKEQVEKEVLAETERQAAVARDKAARWVRQEKDEIKKSRSKTYAEAAADKKRLLLGRRGELADQLFDGVSKALLDFTTSDEYGDYLEKLLGEALTFGQAFTLTVMPRDEAFFRRYQEERQLSHINIIVSKEDFIGGFIAAYDNSNLLLDHSLKNKLVDEKRNFKSVKIQ